MIKRRKQKILSQLKNPICAKAITDFVVAEYDSKCNLDNQHNYSLFSKLTKEASDKFLQDKDPILKRKPWEDEDIAKVRLSVHQKKLKFLHNRSPENKSTYSNAAQILSDLYISKENQYYIQLSEKLMSLAGDNQHSEAWKQINIITGRKARTPYVINANSPEERTQLWVSHFKQLLNPVILPVPEKVVHPNILPDINLVYNDQLFTLDELKIAIKAMQDGKAAGVDELSNDQLKLEDLHPILLDIMNQAYATKTVPAEWSISLLIPVFKKGDSSDPNNYRGIALMSVCAKLYNRLLLERLRSVLDPHLRTNQNGFRKLRSTAQHVLSLRRVFESIRMTQKSKGVAVFIDFCKAFDSVSWTQIEAILCAYQVPNDLVQAIMSIYNGAKAGLFDEDGQLLDDNIFDLSVGVLQGDTLAPYLFVIVMDFIMRMAMSEVCGILIKKKTGTTRRGSPPVYLTDLDFADDIALLSSTIPKAQRLVNALERAALKVNLRINQKKSEFILFGEWGVKKQRDIKVLAGPLQKVEDYKYLGSWLLNSTTDFLIRKDLAWVAIKKLYRVWRSHTIDRQIKINLFLATIESIFLYNATTWTMTKSLEIMLDGAYTKLLRYALNVSWKDHITNVELFGKLPKVSVRLRERRLTFAGHCWRCHESAPQPIHDLLFWSVPDGVQKKGNWTTYVKVLLEDYGGEKVKKGDLNGAILQIKEAMGNRITWKKVVKSICK